MERLREMMTVGQAADARRLTHSLKSSAASLGMNEVQRMAVELEAAIAKDGMDADIDALVSRLEGELHRLVSAILTSLPATPAHPVVIDVDWQRVKQVLLELEPLLASGNMQANRIIEDHRVLLHAAFGPIGTELAKRTERFLYTEAMETLKVALAELSAHET
jgi:HPt (histidine-containing phosphotransfer) domain-containing protein